MGNVLRYRSVVLPINTSNRDLPQASGALSRESIASIRNGLESNLINDRESVVSYTDEITDESGG